MDTISAGWFLPGIGYATYRITILLPVRTPPPALKFLDMGTAYAVFANGEQIISVGKTGSTAGRQPTALFAASGRIAASVKKSGRAPLLPAGIPKLNGSKKLFGKVIP